MRLGDPDSGFRLRIDRADPVIRIEPGLLAEIPPPGSGYPATFDSDTRVLRIEGMNRTVVYRIREMLEARPGCVGYWDYIGEWPD